jgi:L-rhamnose isomerase / sugar isomerase
VTRLDRDYDHLAQRLSDTGRDVDAISTALGGFDVETPSWGYGDSGTRFATFQQPGRPRDVFERLQDAAEVNRLTGAASAVALHFPWDHVDDLAALRSGAVARSADRSRQSEPVPGP